MRPEPREAVEALHKEGIKVAMITGDVAQVATAVAADLSIEEVFAEVLPEAPDDPWGVVAVATLSSASYRKMQQDLWWAAG